jgi:predicted hotdog family 3-hydroxylacyl-ACP dehydratase
MSGLGFLSFAQANFSCQAALLLGARTTASNSHELNLTIGIALNFAEEIAIRSPCNIIDFTCSVSPSEVTN